MKFISHRGNLTGQEKSQENRPDTIEKAVNLGFDVEVDVWKTDSGLFLGHDSPDYFVSSDFLSRIRENLWIHAKNEESIVFLSQRNFRWFWHENDKITLTSKNEIWSYPEIFIENSVVNQPGDDSIFWREEIFKKKKFLGICHDDIVTARRRLSV
jgi:hypothetical protein